MSGDIRYISIIELIGGIGGVLFVVLYTWLTRWGWLKNEYGRNVMFFTAAVSFFFVYGSIYYFVEYPRRSPLFMLRIQEIVMGVIVLLLWQRLFQMVKAQMSRRGWERKR